VSRRRLLQRVPRKLAALAGYELVRREPSVLRRVQEAGVRPRGVIDVGAALGDWSRGCARVFPDARYLLAEPVEEFRPALEAAATAIGHADVVAAAVADAPGTRTLNVHDDLVGSSLLREREGPQVDGSPRAVEVTTVDRLVAEYGLEPPVLLKIDVQGAEGAVVAGATETLRQTEAVVAEVSFFGFFVGGTPFEALVTQLYEARFVVFDIGNLARRPLDGALSQADITFVPEDSPARREHVYARPDQRAAQTAEFAAAIRRRIERDR